MILDKVPKEAWIIVSLSGLTLSVGVSISTIRSSNLSLEIADVKVETTAKLSRVVELSKNLEQQKIILQEKEAAYQKLKTQYENLLDNNQPIKLLEPAIEEVDRVNANTNLEELGEEIKQTGEEASAEIEEIVEDNEHTTKESDDAAK